MSYSKRSQTASTLGGLLSKKLIVEQVEQIDKLLSLLRECGEIHLIVQQGELKYINKVESHKARKDEEHD
jgi:hypothetical protein